MALIMPWQKRGSMEIEVVAGLEHDIPKKERGRERERERERERADRLCKVIQT